MKTIIIGGIAAGTSAAAKAKRSNPAMELTLYERGDIVSFGSCGLPYYVGNIYDDADRMIARTPDQLRQSGIDVKLGHEVTAVDPVKKTVTVKNLATGAVFEDNFDLLMVATGSQPTMPPFRNKELKNIHTFKTLHDGNAIRSMTDDLKIKNVAIIGAGFIGVELADMLLHKGKAVRLIQLDSHVMPEVLDDEFSVLIEEELRSKGVMLHLSEAVSGFEGVNDVVQQVITDKGCYDADLVVVCTGVRPNTKFLEGSGIDTDRGAVLVNEYGQTNFPFIYSAGDCATIWHRVKQQQVYLPLATGANKLGRIVGQNMAEGNSMAFEGSLGSAAIQAIELEVGRTGLSEKEAKALGLNYSTVTIKDKNQTDYCGPQYDIHVKLVYDKATKQILGAQIAGYKGAALRVDVLAAAIFAKMTTKQLGFLDLCYAPQFARTWDCLNTAANAAK
jgi:NADPH-dependent 2,4-dienoyl-CoA reductase/sulfur reductase-like enzyme